MKDVWWLAFAWAIGWTMRATLERRKDGEDMAVKSVPITMTSPALVVIEVFAPDQYCEVDHGDYTITVGTSAAGLTRDDGSPSQPTDVLSVQQDGSLQTRAAGTAGNYERCKKTSAGAVFRPIGASGKTYLVGVATDAPNS